MTTSCDNLAAVPDDALVSDAAIADTFFEWLCRQGDTTLILGQRLSEWCGHGPALEEDIALANIALDMIGHTRLWLGLAGEVEGVGRDADRLAYRRDAMQFRNCLLVELPCGDMAVTLMRQFLFDVFHHLQLSQLVDSASPRVAEIAAKALKEVSYHVERSADLVIRLGDGSAESRRRMQAAADMLWPYCGELFVADAVDAAMAQVAIAPLCSELQADWQSQVSAVFKAATLTLPSSTFVQQGGKVGRHSEHLGFILAEMQFLQRAYPDASW